MPRQGQECRAPNQPRPGSLLGRVARLALDIYRGVCTSFTGHPAHDFLPAVENAVGLISINSSAPSPQPHDMHETADQDLFDFMNDTGVDWPSIFYGADDSWQGPDPFTT